MEDYFNQPLEDLQEDERVVLDHHTGFSHKAPPSSTQPGCTAAAQYANSKTHSPHSNLRFFWHMNKEAPSEAERSALCSANVVPSADFLRERWVEIMNQWGQTMEFAYVLNSKAYISKVYNFLASRALLI